MQEVSPMRTLLLTLAAAVGSSCLSTADDPGVEKEADAWALAASIPDAMWRDHLVRKQPTLLNACLLAQQAGISPAIVAGRVRKETGRYKILGELVGNGEVRKHFPEWSR